MITPAGVSMSGLCCTPGTGTVLYCSYTSTYKVEVTKSRCHRVCSFLGAWVQWWLNSRAAPYPILKAGFLTSQHSASLIPVKSPMITLGHLDSLTSRSAEEHPSPHLHLGCPGFSTHHRGILCDGLLSMRRLCRMLLNRFGFALFYFPCIRVSVSYILQ